MQILYKLGPALFIVDGLSCLNHVENQDQEIPGINVSIHTISTSVDAPICISIENIKVAAEGDVELQMLKRYIIGGWPDSREAVEPGAEKYCLIRHELVMVNGIVMKVSAYLYLVYCRSRFWNSYRVKILALKKHDYS